MKSKLTIAILAMLALAACDQRIGDDTDDRTAGRSSNLILYTDYGTGCQYVRPGGNDGITPRMDANGKQVCKGGRDGSTAP